MIFDVNLKKLGKFKLKKPFFLIRLRIIQTMTKEVESCLFDIHEILFQL